MPQVQFVQSHFVGGLNVELDATKLAANEYPLLVNGRSRFDIIEPVKKPVKHETGLPVGGKLQGIYAWGATLLVFSNGKAYYKDLVAGGDFYKIPSFTGMDASVDQIYACAVPASTVNFNRKAVNDADAKEGVKFGAGAGISSPQCVVVQDGINQPWVIFPDGTSRVTQTFAEWTKLSSPTPIVDLREYVPIGKMMHWDGLRLYICGYNTPDDTVAGRKLNQILRSVSGRPLDFVISVKNSDGDKLATGGDAWAMSHSVSQDDITCIGPVSSDSSAFYVGTYYGSWLVRPDTGSLIFNEPLFNNQWLFSFGAAGPWSLIDTLAGATIVGQSGIRTFDAVSQQKFESKYTNLSAKVFRLFDGQIQSVTATALFDDYALFAVNTLYGPAVLVYDIVRQVWVGLDMYQGVGQIRQFATARTSTLRRLFFITTENECYEAFASTEPEIMRLYTGEWSAESPYENLRPLTFGVTVQECSQAGSIQITPFINRVAGTKITRDLAAKYLPATPYSFPYPPQIQDSVENVTLDFQNALTGNKVGFLVEMDADAKLVATSPRVEKITQMADSAQQAYTLANYTQTGPKNPYKIAVWGNSSMEFTTQTPPCPSVIFPVYGVNGNDLDVIAGHKYYYTFVIGTDLSIINGTETLTAVSGEFTAQTDTVTATGVVGMAMSLTLRDVTNLAALSGLVDDLQPDYIVCTGNINQPWDKASSDIWAFNVTPYLGKWINRGKFSSVLGAWEMDDNGATLIGELDPPPGCRYYKRTVNSDIDLFYLATDASEPDGRSATSIQAMWLKANLAASTSRIKLVFMHGTPYSSQGEVAALQWPFKTWGATAVFCGSVPVYERAVVNGLAYITAGSGGFKNDVSAPWPAVSGAASYTKFLDTSNVGLVLLEIDKFNVSVKFLNTAGQLIDSTVINS